MDVMSRKFPHSFCGSCGGEIDIEGWCFNYCGDDEPSTTTVMGNCVITGKQYSVTVLKANYEKWLEGMLIQDALPDLPTEDREFLISGISPDGWKILMGEER
jgi:hypothetical protein